MTLRDTLRQTTRRLDWHGIPNSRLNAEVLLAHCLAVDKTYLYTYDERGLTDEEAQRLEEAVYERISGTPVQYIVGRQEFFGRYFAVNPAVLIPRPESELIVESVLDLHPPDRSRIIDVGTGSGCIGITLALELPESRVTLTDISWDALRVAYANARSLAANVTVACMDLLDAAAGSFDFIVSNPPYISAKEGPNLQREVREHEPHVALFADDDGLAAHRRLIPVAEKLLAPGGYLIAEIGFGMESRVLDLFSNAWEQLPTRVDLQGIPRTIRARRF